MRPLIALALLACGRSARVPDASPQTVRELVPPGRVDAYDRKPDAATVVATTTGIEGRVLVAGKPMPNVSVSVKHVEGLDIYEIQRVSSDEGGHYKLDVTPNPYLVIIRKAPASRG